MNEYRTTFECLCQLVGAQKLRRGVSEAFDPVLSCEIGSGERSKATVRDARHDTRAIRFSDGSS